MSVFQRALKGNNSNFFPNVLGHTTVWSMHLNKWQYDCYSTKMSNVYTYFSSPFFVPCY